MTQVFGAVIKQMCKNSLALQCSVVAFSTGSSFQLQLTVIILLMLLKEPKPLSILVKFFSRLHEALWAEMKTAT